MRKFFGYVFGLRGLLFGGLFCLGAAAAAAPLLKNAFLTDASARELAAPYVHEFTMAAPDIIRVEIRELGFERGRIVKLPGPITDAKKDNAFDVQYENQWAEIIGPNRDHLRLAGKRIGKPLDRDAVGRLSEYEIIGGPRVLGVYRKSTPWATEDVAVGGGGSLKAVAFRHEIYLRLSDPLRPGQLTIEFPDGTVEASTFDFDPKSTRFSSIRATQHGHRPKDLGKYAYLAFWLPGGPRQGAVDFREYDVDQFQILNDAGEPVFSGKVRLRAGPLDIEPADGLGGDLVKYVRENGEEFFSNRAGTYVFGMDYSRWRNPDAGVYRIYVPGIGVSDPFEIGEDVWLKAARVGMGGLYNQRSGLALDDRFGYERPACFDDDLGPRIIQSRMPLAFSKEGRGFLDFKDAVAAPWRTDEVLTGVSGGYEDAGDWDRRIQHLSVSYLLLDTFEMLPESAGQPAIGTPPSHQVLDADIYEKADFPDLIDEAVWNIDFYRRMQRADGAVRGGIESAKTPLFGEPCWLESQDVFAYAPGPDASYYYAAVAAKLANVLKSIGDAQRAEIFADSARKAWDWAERRGPAELKDAERLLDPSIKDLQKKTDAIQRRAKSKRRWAAASLFRYFGDDALRSVVVDAGGGGLGRIDFGHDHAIWEYLLSKDGRKDFELRNRFERRLIGVVTRHVIEPYKSYLYYNMKHGAVQSYWGNGLVPTSPVLQTVMRAHHLTKAPIYLEMMQNTSAHVLGANQAGLSFTIGLGARNYQTPLHENSIAAGVAPPPGITVFGWSYHQYTSYWWLWNVWWSSLSEENAARKVEPFRRSMPFYEYIIEHDRLIQTSEYTVQQTIGPTAAMWTYLHGWDKK